MLPYLLNEGTKLKTNLRSHPVLNCAFMQCAWLVNFRQYWQTFKLWLISTLLILAYHTENKISICLMFTKLGHQHIAKPKKIWLVFLKTPGDNRKYFAVRKYLPTQTLPDCTRRVHLCAEQGVRIWNNTGASNHDDLSTGTASTHRTACFVPKRGIGSPMLFRCYKKYSCHHRHCQAQQTCHWVRQIC